MVPLKSKSSYIKMGVSMEPIIWEVYLCDLYDLLRYDRGEISWNDVKKRKVRCLVDTGASRTLITRKHLKGLSYISRGKREIHGICKEPVDANLVRLGIAIRVDDEILGAIDDVFLLIDEEEGRRITEVLQTMDAEAILGRTSMDALGIRPEPATKKPQRAPAVIL